MSYGKFSLHEYNCQNLDFRECKEKSSLPSKEMALLSIKFLFYDTGTIERRISNWRSKSKSDLRYLPGWFSSLTNALLALIFMISVMKVRTKFIKMALFVTYHGASSVCLSLTSDAEALVFSFILHVPMRAMRKVGGIIDIFRVISRCKCSASWMKMYRLLPLRGIEPFVSMEYGARLRCSWRCVSGDPGWVYSLLSVFCIVNSKEWWIYPYVM